MRWGIMWISGAAQGELRPTLTSVTAKRALVLATQRSQAWAIIQPPAKAMPLTAAITGLGVSRMTLCSVSKPARRRKCAAVLER